MKTKPLYVKLISKILEDHGPLTIREIMDALISLPNAEGRRRKMVPTDPELNNIMRTPVFKVMDHIRVNRGQLKPRYVMR